MIVDDCSSAFVSPRVLALCNLNALPVTFNGTVVQ